MMLISRSCSYALRAVLYVAAYGHDRWILIREVSDQLGISFSFLGKIVQQLSRAGILVSHKGPGGGIALAKPARDIALLDIVRAIDGANALKGCLLGLPECSDDAPCPLHEHWKGIRENILHLLEHKSVAELLSQEGSNVSS